MSRLNHSRQHQRAMSRYRIAFALRVGSRRAGIPKWLRQYNKRYRVSTTRPLYPGQI